MRNHNETICTRIDFITADTIAAMAYGLGMDHYSKQLESDLLDNFDKRAIKDLDALIDACGGINDARLCRSDECPQYCWAKSGFMESVRLALLAEQKTQQKVSQDVCCDLEF